eukprot:1641184-Prymnesium_polylepis.1
MEEANFEALRLAPRHDCAIAKSGVKKLRGTRTSEGSACPQTTCKALHGSPAAGARVPESSQRKLLLK